MFRRRQVIATTCGKDTAALRLDRGLIDQHDRDIVLDRIDAVALGALQTLGILSVLERLLAGRADQDFEQFFGNHDLRIVRQLRSADSAV